MSNFPAMLLLLYVVVVVVVVVVHGIFLHWLEKLLNCI